PVPPPSTAAAYAANGAPVAPLPRRPASRPVVIICIDTLRADSLDPWPGSRGLMPGLSAWCKKNAVVFRQAASAAPWTGPSIASLLSGLLPSRHGGREFSASFRVVDAVPTLAEILAAQGWRTAAYTGGGWVSKATGMLQGFERAREPFSFAGGGGQMPALYDKMRTMPERLLF